MEPIDSYFFEEYKQLDKLCSEMYSCQNGVSEYISQMESKAFKGQNRIFTWDSDYKKLKHIRWVRNQIAHDSSSFQKSEIEDIEFVQNFYNRIFSGNDPLTLLRKALENDEERRKQIKKSYELRKQQVTVDSSNANNKASQTISITKASDVQKQTIKPKHKKNNVLSKVASIIAIGVAILIFLYFYLS